MTPATTYSVFLSSTGRDLQDYRDAAVAACNSIDGLTPVGMEFFENMGKGATAASLAKLDACHLYIGFYAYRYGFVEPGGDPRSVTEREFDHAKDRMDRLCFLMSDDACPMSKVEKDKLHLQEAFRECVRLLALRDFTTVDNFRRQFEHSLRAWLDRQQAATASAPRASVPRQIAPPPAADFVGRADDLAALLAGFDGGATITGLRGLGGVGKTTLALALAKHLATRFPDGQIQLDLRGVGDNPVTVRDALGHVIRAFHEDVRLPDGDDAVKGLYHTVLAGKRVLLLMDNAADARQVEPLRPPAGCALIVTSRRRFTLPGLMARDLDALPPADAVSLLRSLAPSLDGVADTIASLCGCLPLALRLAGSLLAERDDLVPAVFVERLRKARLAERSGLAEVAAAIRLSEEMLPAPLRRKWHELALLVGGFEMGWAAAAWETDADTADDWLGTLRRNSLIEWDAADQFYRLHDLVREYLHDALDEDRRQLAARRHAQFFTDEVCDANAAYKEGGDAIVTALGRFDRAWPNAQGAFAWVQRVFEKDDEIAELCGRLVNGCWSIRELRQPVQDRIQWLNTALQAARRVDDRDREGIALGNLGSAYVALGQPQQAIDYYEQRLIIARDAGDRLGEGAALGNLGVAYADLGQLQRAIDLHEQQLVIARNIGDRHVESAALGNLGVAYADLDQPKRAIDFHAQQLVIARNIGDRHSQGVALGNLGNAYSDLGQPQQANEFYEQRLVIAHEIGDRRGEAITCWNMGLQLIELNRFAEAIPLMEVSIAFEREIGHSDAEKHAAHVEELRRRLDAGK